MTVGLDTIPEAFAEISRAEAARVWELYQAGVIHELCFRQDKTQAVQIPESSDIEDIEEALDSLNTLPLVRAGLIAFDLIPLRADPGFARLFEQSV